MNHPVWGIDTAEEWLLSFSLCFSVVAVFLAFMLYALFMMIIYAMLALVKWDINLLMEKR